MSNPFDALERVQDALAAPLRDAVKSETGVCAVLVIAENGGGPCIIGGTGIGRREALDLLLDTAVAHAEQVLGYDVVVTRPERST